MITTQTENFYILSTKG